MAGTGLTTSPRHKRHMTVTRSFSVLQLSATSRAGLPPRTSCKPANFPPHQQKREGQKPAGHGERGENTQKKVVALHKRFQFP